MNLFDLQRDLRYEEKQEKNNNSMRRIYYSSMNVLGQDTANPSPIECMWVFAGNFDIIRRYEMKGRLVDTNENNKDSFLMESHLIRFHALFVVWLFAAQDILMRHPRTKERTKKNFLMKRRTKKRKKMVYRKKLWGDFCSG